MDKNCPFCRLESGRDIIMKNDFAFAIYDNYPVSKGHALIIPNDHIDNYFELHPEVQKELWNLVVEIKNIIDKEYKPDGYNIGININSSAGQTVPHVHIHLIPRYKGDTENPRGGIRHIIPGKGYY